MTTKNPPSGFTPIFYVKTKRKEGGAYVDRSIVLRPEQLPVISLSYPIFPSKAK